MVRRLQFVGGRRRREPKSAGRPAQEAIIMELSGYQLVRATARVRQAMGYHELGMVEHALECLAATERMGDLGAFQLVVDMLRAEVQHRQENYDAAAKALEEAAQKLPPAASRSLWMAISMCYREAGDTDRAVTSLARARGAKPEPMTTDD
jgi:tetratricopeptide (TPR) repeat protein